MLTPLTMKREPGAIKRLGVRIAAALIVIGVMSPFLHPLVLTAMVNTPVSYVAPAREVSIPLALLGAYVLNEGDATKRTIAALGMVLGVSALAIG